MLPIDRSLLKQSTYGACRVCWGSVKVTSTESHAQVSRGQLQVNADDRIEQLWIPDSGKEAALRDEALAWARRGKGYRGFTSTPVARLKRNA